MPISGYLVDRAFLYIWGFGCLVNLVNLAPKCMQLRSPLIKSQMQMGPQVEGGVGANFCYSLGSVTLLVTTLHF